MKSAFGRKPAVGPMVGWRGVRLVHTVSAMSTPPHDGSTLAAPSAPLSGRVKWFDTKKGFGFILGPTGQDVFVHFSNILTDGFRSLKDGEPVEYVLADGDRGLHARHVRRVTRPDKALASDDPHCGHAAAGAAGNLAATLDPAVTPSMAPTVLPDRPHEPQDPSGV